MKEFTGSAASQADFIWKNAEDLWGDFKHTDFGKIILPFTLLRRLECALESTRDEVRDACNTFKDKGIDMNPVLRNITHFPFYNTSEYSLSNLGSTKTLRNLENYISEFSDNARAIFEEFDFGNTINRLEKSKLLFKICTNFSLINLHPDRVPDRVMSNIYEHLIRRFGSEVNESAEDFMTPRDLVNLATSMLLDPDDHIFIGDKGIIRTIYDPTCGTGGFLTDAMNHVDQYVNESKTPPTLIPHGQELEPETHAVCVASMLIRRLPSDQERDLSENIRKGSTLSDDQFKGKRFHYCLSNPPFGKKWEKDKDAVIAEYNQGYSGRFGPGLPRVNDGSMLFLMHIAHKLELPQNGGGRAAIVLSGSPLFNGGAGSGESEIRRWLMENDLIDAIVALPTEIFFRTTIATYLWILSNKKPKERRNKVQLIDASDIWTTIKNEGNKRREISDEQRHHILNVYAAAENNDISKVVDYREFGYRRVKVLRPLRMVIKIDEKSLTKLTTSDSWLKLKLSDEQQNFWHQALLPHLDQVKPYSWIEEFTKEAVKTPEAKRLNVKTNKSLVTSLLATFGHKDKNAEPVLDAHGNVIADKDLIDFENVPYTVSVEEYFNKEVLPYVPDAYIDESFVDEKDNQPGKVGFEFNFNRFFYKYQPPRKLEDIDTDLKLLEKEITELLEQL